jgi:hypothetical protein
MKVPSARVRRPSAGAQEQATPQPPHDPPPHDPPSLAQALAVAYLDLWRRHWAAETTPALVSLDRADKR